MFLGKTTRARTALMATIMLASATSAVTTATAVEAEGDFVGDFDKAARLMLEGQGGLDGIGMTKMWPRISAPALTGEQIRKIVTGNTVRNNESVALYFSADSTVEAWFDDWTAVAAGVKCPSPEVGGDEYSYRENACQKKTIVPVKGSWEVRDDKLCPKLVWATGKNETCWYVALILDKVVLFDEAGKLLGFGKSVKRGKVLDQVVD